eukprot:scpid31419/ scgid25468/ 
MLAVWQRPSRFPQYVGTYMDMYWCFTFPYLSLARPCSGFLSWRGLNSVCEPVSSKMPDILLLTGVNCHSTQQSCGQIRSAAAFSNMLQFSRPRADCSEFQPLILAASVPNMKFEIMPDRTANTQHRSTRAARARDYGIVHTVRTDDGANMQPPTTGLDPVAVFQDVQNSIRHGHTFDSICVHRSLDVTYSTRHMRMHRNRGQRSVPCPHVHL